MLILASASPRRQELLRNAGVAFAVRPADIAEIPLAGERARGCAERLARAKAGAVHQLHPQDFVLGADTIVVVDDIMLGKPRDADDAARMLRMLSGREHCVITGVSLLGPACEVTASETTGVTMAEISGDEIRDYIATGEPLDKAGAYAIQGIAWRWIRRIEGDYTNVVGLPLARVTSMLRDSGVG